MPAQTAKSMIEWQCCLFSELGNLELYGLLRLRTDIFIVEQQCPYPELDGKDTLAETRHLQGYRGDTLIAYARLLPPGAGYDNVSIGRVAVSKSARGDVSGHELLEQALAYCQKFWPEHKIDIGAQVYLQAFYQRHGFVVISDSYLEDGIEHIDMRWAGRADNNGFQ